MKIYNCIRTDLFKAILILGFIILVSFYDIIFLNKTLLTSNTKWGTSPEGFGVFGYNGHQSRHDPVIDPGASAWFFEPMAKLVSDIYRSYQIPMWNPHAFLGMPISPLEHPSFYPLYLLIYLFPNASMWDIFMILRVFLAGIFMYLYLSHFRFNFYIRLIGAVSYMLTGHIILHINMVWLNIELLFPLLLLTIHKLIEEDCTGTMHRAPIKNIFYIGLIIFLMFTGAFPETIFFVLIFSVAYFIYNLWISARVVMPKEHRQTSLSMPPTSLSIKSIKGIDLRKVMIKSGYFITSLSIGSISSAFLILPFIEHLSYISLYRGIYGLSHVPFEGLIILFVPYFFGWPNTAWNGMSWNFQPGYIGMIVTFFILFSIVSIKRVNNKLNYFLIGCIIIFLCKAYGLPYFNELIGSLPLLKHVLFSRYATISFNICSSLILSLSLQYIISHDLNSKRVMTVLTILVSIILIYIAFYINQIIGLDLKKLLFLSFQVFFALLILIGLFYLLISLKTHRISLNTFLILMLFLISMELTFYIPKERGDRYNPYVGIPYVEYLKEDKTRFRVFGLDGIMYPCISSAYGVDDIRIMTSLVPLRFAEFFKEFLDKDIPRVFHVWKEIDFIPKRMADLVNLRYFIVPYRELSTMEEILNRYPFLSGYQEIYDKDHVAIFKNPDPLPRAYMVYDYEVIKDKDKIFKRLKEDSFDIRRSVILEKDIIEVIDSNLHTDSEDKENVEIIEYSYNKVKIRTESAKDGILILGDAYFPGWKAKMGDKKLDIFPANYILRGVFVPAGKHIIEFYYLPESWVAGGIISLSTLLLSLSGWFVYVYRGNHHTD